MSHPPDDQPAEEDDFQQLGVFEAHRAKEVLEKLEANGIPFELDYDESGQVQPGRTTQLIFGIYPAGTAIYVFVPKAAFARATDLTRPFLSD